MTNDCVSLLFLPTSQLSECLTRNSSHIFLIPPVLMVTYRVSSNICNQLHFRATISFSRSGGDVTWGEGIWISPPGSAGYMFIIPMQTGAYSIEHL